MLKKWKWILISVVGIALTGCSYIPKYADYESLKSYLAFDFSTPRMTKVNIRTTKVSNYGAPFYVMIQATNFSNFLTYDYEKVTAAIFTELDENCLACFCVVPNTNQTIKIDAPPGTSIAIYCLFTHPGEGWKRFFEITESRQTIKIMIGENEITSVD